MLACVTSIDLRCQHADMWQLPRKKSSRPHLHIDVLDYARALSLGRGGGREDASGRGRSFCGRGLGRGRRRADAGGSRCLGCRRSRRRRLTRATRADDRSGEVATLNVHAREVPVLGLAIVGQAEDTQVPVGAVGVCGNRDWTGGFLQGIGTSGVVELDASSAEVDTVGDVVPGVGGELGVPLRLASGVPVEVVVRAALGTVLHFGEVALKEVDLVLSSRRRRVGACVLHGEVVEDLALVDGGAGLGDQLGTEHGLAVPRRGLVVGDLDALLGAGVGRVLGVGIEVDIALGFTGSWSYKSVMFVDNA